VVLRLIGEAKGTKDIASALQVSIRVVQKHRASLVKKLNVSSFCDLATIDLHANMDGKQYGNPAPWLARQVTV
jgi:DNA-binding NarL/FixJ family response regulator